MGLGPSLHARCKSTLCENHEQVKYILKSSNVEYEQLYKPWFIYKSLSNDISTYWACDSCFKLVHNQNLFTYNPDYVVYGL